MILWGLWACTQSDPVVVPDADGDGFDASVDCDDTDADAFPGSPEFCDGVDNDCNGAIDDGTPWGTDTFFVDADGDGFGVEGVEACEQPPGTIRRGGDCDDNDPLRFPGHAEICNGIDEDCDGAIDEEPDPLYFADEDGDGFGDPEAVFRSCEPDPSWVNNDRDCNDALATVHPDATERCNGVDDNCDGLSDDADPLVEGPEWFADVDEDGFGSDLVIATQCAAPAGSWVSEGGDCDDTDETAHPGAVEVCDGIDQDCDGLFDSPTAQFLAGPRVPVSMTSSTLRQSPWMRGVVDLDAAFRDAGGVGTLPSGVRFAYGDCQSGYTELPAHFVDSWNTLSVRGPSGDGQGLLGIVFDSDGVAATPELFEAGTVEGFLHFGFGTPGGIEIDLDRLESGATVAQFDTGLRLSELQFGGFIIANQPFVARVDTPAVGIVAQTTMPVASGDGSLGRLVGQGLDQGIQSEVEWWMPAGPPVLYARVALSTESDVAVQGVTGFAFEPQGEPLAVHGGWLFRTPDTVIGVSVLDAPDAAMVNASANTFTVSGTDVTLTEGVVGPGQILSEVTVALVLGSTSAEVELRLAELEEPGVLGF